MELKTYVALYAPAANDVIQNLTGYAELATTIPADDLHQLREFRNAMTKAAKQAKVFRGQVLNGQNARMLTRLTRSMRLLGVVIDSQVETTETIAEAFGTIIHLAEGKSASKD